MPDIIKCPYCVQGNDFSAMSARADGRWFLCVRCAHVVIPDNPAYRCNCAKCVEVGLPLSSDTK